MNVLCVPSVPLCSPLFLYVPLCSSMFPSVPLCSPLFLPIICSFLSSCSPLHLYPSAPFRLQPMKQQRKRCFSLSRCVWAWSHVRVCVWLCEHDLMCACVCVVVWAWSHVCVCVCVCVCVVVWHSKEEAKACPKVWVHLIWQLSHTPGWMHAHTHYTHTLTKHAHDRKWVHTLRLKI